MKPHWNISASSPIPSIVIFDCPLILQLFHAVSNSPLLYDTFESSLADKLIALSLNILSCENSVSQNYDGWAFSNYSGLDTSLSSGNISEIYSSITPDHVESFLSKYQENYHKVFKNHSF